MSAADRSTTSGYLTDSWSPTQYERFRDERSQPFFDLLDLVEARPSMDVIDLGCGTGELTLELHRRLAARATHGIDASEAMLARAARIQEPHLGFARQDITTLDGESQFDLVFSNAALQWVPDHESLVPRLIRLARPGGQIAFQMPANDDHPSHTTAAALAGESPYREALRGFIRRDPPLRLERYVEILHEHDCEQIHARTQVYVHLLETTTGVIEWVRGTMLTDYQRRLPDALFARFIDAYRERLLATLPDRSPYLYTYPRLLIRAVRRA